MTLLEKINQAKLNTETGKKLIADAISSKGIDTPINATYETMATNIESISGSSGGSEIDGQKIVNYPLGEDMESMTTCYKANWEKTYITSDIYDLSIKNNTHGMDLSNDKQYLAIGYKGKGIVIYQKDEFNNYINEVDIDINLVTTGEWYPKFSPNGQYLAVVDNSYSKHGVFVYKLVDGTWKKMTTPKIAQYGKPIEWINNEVFISSVYGGQKLYVYKLDGEQFIEVPQTISGLYTTYALQFVIDNGYLIYCEMGKGISIFKINEDYTLTKETFTGGPAYIGGIISLGNNQYICGYITSYWYLLDINFETKTITKTELKYNSKSLDGGHLLFFIKEKNILLSTSGTCGILDLESKTINNILHPVIENEITTSTTANYILSFNDKILLSANYSPYLMAFNYKEFIKKANNKIGDVDTLGYLPVGGSKGQNKNMVVLFER